MQVAPGGRGGGGTRGTGQPPDRACRLKTPPLKPPHLPGPAFRSPPRPRVPRGLEPRSHLPDASGSSVLGPVSSAGATRQSRSLEGLTLRRRGWVGAVRSRAASTRSPPPARHPASRPQGR